LLRFRLFLPLMPQ
jgi:hypothetical protein